TRRSSDLAVGFGRTPRDFGRQRRHRRRGRGSGLRGAGFGRRGVSRGAPSPRAASGAAPGQRSRTPPGTRADAGAGKSSDVPTVTAKAPPMTPSDAAGGTATTGDKSILAPPKVNISARPAFRTRSLAPSSGPLRRGAVQTP